MKLMELMKEASQDTPGQVMQRAKLAKTRADMRQLGSQQKTLGQSKKNASDIPSKRRISKQIADLGVKKADMGIKTADMSSKLKKPSKLREGAEDDSDDVMTIAKNEQKFYAKRDAKGAIEYAIKEHIKDITQDILDDLTRMKSMMIRDLQDYWKHEDKAPR